MDKLLSPINNNIVHIHLNRLAFFERSYKEIFNIDNRLLTKKNNCQELDLTIIE